MNYSDLKKLDEETLEKLTEGVGPSDECLCSILAPPEGGKRGLRQSIKKAFASIGQGRQERKRNRTPFGRHGGEVVLASDNPGHNSVDIPLTFTKGGKGIYTTREAVKRMPSCNKCRCESENIVLKHSFANIRITSPDVSSLCPCPSECLAGKEKLQNNIKVTIERLAVDSVAAASQSGSQNSFSDLPQSSLDTIPQSENSTSLEDQDLEAD